MRLFLRAIWIWLLVVSCSGSAGLFAMGADPANVKVRNEYPVHPVLIRQQYAPLTRVVCEVATSDSANGLRLASLRFDLSSTDNLADLESLRLYGTGSNREFATADPIGESVPVSQSVRIVVDRDLGVGTHTFWLSGRLRTAADLSHSVAAACVAAETSRGEIVPANPNPTSRHHIGYALRQHNDDGVHTYRIPALATSAKGSLLCVYDMRRRMGRDLQEDIDIGLSRSVDGGRTWEPTRVIMDLGEYGGLPPSENGCSDPGILVDRQTGRVFCFALWMHGKPGHHQWVDDGSEPGFEIGRAAQFMAVYSDDDGQTWSKPENLTRQLKQESWWLFAPSPQQGIQLADGTLVMPVQGREGREPLQTFATIMTSRDHGATWTVGKPAFRGGNECQAAPLHDGSIMLNIRNDHERFRAVVVTKDLGETWSEHATSRQTLVEPNCNGSLRRIDYVFAGQTRHALLFANPHSQQGRTHHSIQVSFDDGATWPASHRRLLDEGRGAGYPSLTQIDADHFGIVYEGSQSQLVFERFAIRELVSVPDKVVALTFDDASKSHFTVARPLLLKYGFGATFFVTEGWDMRTNHRDYMSWEEIAQLHRDGFEIGNHTRDHLGITAKNVAKLDEQLAGIEDRCREHGIPRPVTFAWPGNATAVEAFDILRQHGILFARRGGAPEWDYESGRGVAYEPGQDHPLLLPSAGDAKPQWELADFVRAVEQARAGRVAVLQFHGVPDTAHSWVNTPSDRFESYLSYLATHGYHVVALRDLAQFLDPHLEPADPMAVIKTRQAARK